MVSLSCDGSDAYGEKSWKVWNLGGEGALCLSAQVLNLPATLNTCV